MNFAVPNLLLIAAAVAPALLFLALLTFLPKSPVQWLAPRPVWTVAVAMATGVGSAFIALPVEMLLTASPWKISNLGMLALFALIAAGLAEEGAKYVCVRLVSWNFSQFRERFDGLLYCGAVGLGFGAIENIFYVVEGGLETAAIRAFTAVPFHGMLGLVLGYFLGTSKVRQLAGEPWGNLHFQGLFWAVVLHGVYDLFAFQGGLVPTVMLFSLLGALAIWSVRMVFAAGQPRPPGVAQNRHPRHPSSRLSPCRAIQSWQQLGLVPGVGQFYNREWQKGSFLLTAGVLNLLILVGVWLFIQMPLNLVVGLLVFGGVGIDGLKPENLTKVSQDVAASPLLPVLIAVNLVFCLLSAFDAWRTARTGNFDYLAPPEKRTRFVQSFSASYIGHLLVLVFAILVPSLSGGGSRARADQPGQPGVIEFDLVTAPKKLDGFSGKPEGTEKGKDKKNAPRVLAQKSAPARVPGPTAPKPQEAQEAKGLPRSYNEYLSWKIRRHHDLYFDQVGSGQYTVVQYEIDASGNVTNVRVLYDHTTAPGEVAELAAETVRHLDPALPLPPGIRSVTITELFWDGSPIGSPGSLEQRLSELPDGREVVPDPPQADQT